MTTRVAVDYERCIASGMCTSIVPEIFEIGDDGKLRILVEDLSPNLLEKAENAVVCCPVEALSLQGNGKVDGDGGALA